jgi:endonuclease/exonuclease/phosphatase family metal-dependent hydrolase
MVGIGRRRWAAGLLGFALLCLGLGPARAAASPVSPLPHRHGRFEVLTYNVAGLPEGISRARPLASLPRIGELLNRYDIALVQEDFAYPLELRRGIRHPHASAPFVRTGLDFGDGLSQFSRFPLTNLQREAWSSCNGIFDAFFDCLTPKGFSMVRVELGAEALVHVYNVHMDAGRTGADRAAREAQVKQLVAAIARDSAGQAVIVGGDTNLLRRDRDLLERLLAGASLSDSCAHTRCPQPWRIDRVLYRSSAVLNLRPSRWRIASEFVGTRDRPLSDHLAVAVRFEWAAGTEHGRATGARAGGSPPAVRSAAARVSFR